MHNHQRIRSGLTHRHGPIKVDRALADSLRKICTRGIEPAYRGGGQRADDVCCRADHSMLKSVRGTRF